MHKYFIHIPWWIQTIFPKYTWRLAEGNKVFLTFDDGPHPAITPWVLDLLETYHAKATFFCIGKNVVQHPRIYQRILDEGHSVGNHTFNHLDGWKVSTELYVKNIELAAALISSTLFRPPYGKITRAQWTSIQELGEGGMDVIMWDVLSGDFDASFSPERCIRNVTRHARRGSIIVFHDSEKASHNLFAVLPQVLQFLTEKGYVLDKIGAGTSTNN